MIQFSRQEKLVLLILSAVAVVALALTFFTNFNAQRKLSEKETVMVVQVDGAVVNPGVYKVKEGTRVFEILQEAGGTTSGADLGGINLAQPVYDGQRISIPSRQKQENPAQSFSTNFDQFLPREARTPAGTKRININTASQEELVSLPGIGDVIAKRIIEYRQSQGPFRRPEDLLKVKGIGPKKLEKIRDLLSF